MLPGPARVVQHLGQVVQVLAHQGDVGGFDRDVGAHGTHGDTGVGGRQGRGVVHAVPDHGGGLPGLERADDLRFVLGAKVGVDLGDARGLTQRGGRDEVVAGEHGRGVTGSAQPGDDLAGFGAQLVTDRDRPDDQAVVLDQDSGGAGVLHPLDLGGQRTGVDPARPAEADGPALEPAFQTGAGDGVHIGDGRPVRGGGEDGAGERMFAAGLQSGSEGQDVFPGGCAGRSDVDHGGLVAGERSGLVQCDGADFAEGLQGAAALDEHADAAGRAHGGDDRHGHGDGQCAGRGGDQDDEGAFEPQQRLPDDEAEDNDQDSGDQDARDELAGDGVGQALARSLAGLLGLHDVHDPGQ